MDSNKTLFESTIKSLELLGRGKVRENYAVDDDKLLIVTTDRISAFDVIMAQPIPNKGRVLTQMALFWFDQLADVVPNHLTGIDPADVVAADEIDQVQGRAMVVKRLQPLPVEAVVRGYIIGSGWKDYQQTGAICGIELPMGLEQAQQLAEPIFTPATKAQMGDHDENISFDQMLTMVRPDLAHRIRSISITLYERARAFAAQRGIIIADTKFEFGLDENGGLHLMDEILTADSSRFWPADSYATGISPPSFDKQFLRDYLESVPGWGKVAPPPTLPENIINETSRKYEEALNRLTGTTLA
jgi:phosphoribosylaminoimidazole-succinocarboxamide synthase